MDKNNLTKKEIVEINTNILEPSQNVEINKIEINNQEKSENKDELPQPKLKLKKKVNKLKMPAENNNIPNEQIPIPNVEIELFNNNDVQNTNNINNIKENIIEIKNEKIIQGDNKGYLDDDLEDEDNKKLYLRVIKRMEKTYGVPVISAEIKGEKIEDIELEENVRPILINKENINTKEKPKNNIVDTKSKNNINNKVINNNKNKENKENIINNSYNNPNNKIYNNVNNNYYTGKKQNIINNPTNNNNLINSLNLNSKSFINYGPKYYLSHTGLYNKIINNNDLLKKYRNYTGKNMNNINSRIIGNKGNTLPKPRQNSYERIEKNLQKRLLNKKYPIYDPNLINIASNKFNNLKYYNLIDDFPNFASLKKLNQRKYNYPLKRTYYICYNNNRNKQNYNLINAKSNKNYFNYNSLNINKTPIIPKNNNKYFNEYKNNYKNYNLSNPSNNANRLFKTNKKNNILLNKSENIRKGKNILESYTGQTNHYNYGRNAQNLLSLTQDLIERSNKKYNNTPFHSYNNNKYNLNYNYSNEENISNGYNSGIKMPIKEIKFTYYINSRYN